jgi:SynChlorMet cassette radical SAM/SPASM protein ScmF
MSCLPEEKTAASAAEMQALDLPEGVPPLHSLYMYIAGSCNLACRHCWVEPDFSPDRSKGKFLKLEWAKKAVVEARPLGLRSVKLTGGEPLFHPQFREIVGVVAQEGVDIVIETNGTLVDAGIARFLKDAGRVCFISVSVDGARAETHENLRGIPGSFEKAIEGIRVLVEAGFRPQLICTLHKGNVDEIEEVIALAERLGCGSVKFNHVQRMGRGEGLIDKVGLGVADIIRIYNRIEGEYVPQTSIPVYFDIPFAFFSIKKLLRKDLGRCMVHNLLSILAGGEISLCGVGFTVPELIFGHIDQVDLKGTWLDSPGLKELRRLIPFLLEGICGECIHRNFCMGECVANNFHLGGRLNSPYEFCRLAEKAALFPPSRKNPSKRFSKPENFSS